MMYRRYGYQCRGDYILSLFVCWFFGLSVSLNSILERLGVGTSNS